MSILSQLKHQCQRMVKYARKHSVLETAIRYKVSRKTVYKWLSRYVYSLLVYLLWCDNSLLAVGVIKHKYIVVETEPWRGSQFLALKRLTRHRLHLVECTTREKAYLVSNLYLKFSELQMLEKDDQPLA